ncbi:hypothetical protein ACULUB_001210 [Acinetobacter baumannii]|nr:hypothetical protein [Acinetobacter baumannii]MDO7421675.1 hypothetical protein [Acinetobacter baumannii]
MTDIKDNKFVRFSDFDIAQGSQFKEFNYEQEKTPIQKRLYFLMLNGKQPRGDKESLYGWCARIGLSKSTAFGIFSKGNQNMHLSVAQTISDATGADVDWIKNGTGVPFPVYSMDEIINKQIEEAIEDQILETNINPEFDGLDTQLLQQAFDTLDKALKVTKRSMSPKAKAKFVVSLYDNLSEPGNAKIELLQECIETVEQALLDTRRIMSSSAKSELILIIYDLYYGNTAYKEAMKTTLDELIRSTS